MQKRVCLLILCLLGILISSSIFGAEKKPARPKLTEIVSPTDWSSALKTLLNGKYLLNGVESDTSANFFGEVVSGPFIQEKENSERLLIVIMRKRGEYFRLSKLLADLHSFEKATHVESGSNNLINPVDGPTFSGYSEITMTGLEVLNYLVSNRDWTISRMSEWMDGSENTREIFQNIKIFLSGRLDELSVETNAEAFGSWSGERFVYSHKILGQVTGDGTYRFLIWTGSQLSNFSVGAAHFALIDHQIITSTDKLSIYSDDKVCVGEICRPLSEVNLTQKVAPRYIVLEFNPDTPGQLSVVLNQVAIESPVLRFQYAAPFPVVPVMPSLCNSYAETELRAAVPGFKCRLSKFGPTGKVGIFERVEYPAFGEAWRGPDGAIWSDIHGKSSRYHKAVKTCSDVGGRLPSIEELDQLRNYFDWSTKRTSDLKRFFDGFTRASSTEFEKLFPNTKPYWWEWTNSKNIVYDFYGNNFDLDSWTGSRVSGGLFNPLVWQKASIRCVSN